MTTMSDKSSTGENEPVRQRPDEAPRDNHDEAGRIVGDSTESNGIGETAWGTTADLTPENADEASTEGYANSPRNFDDLRLPNADPTESA